MRILILILLLFCTTSHLHAQDDSLKTILYQGVALHDKGDYEGAIRLYDEVIARDPDNLLAWYEKSLSLLVSQRYQDCIDLCTTVLKKFKEGNELDNIYVNYGSALDAAGKPAEAIKIYSQGIKKYNHYLLFFNRGITEYGQKKIEDAIADFQQTLLLHPLHASSHQYLGYAVYGTNKVASLMSLTTFLLIEYNSNRSEKNLKILQDLYGSYAKQTGEKSVTISIDASLLDTKKKPDNFSITEMSIALMSASDFEDSLKSLSPAVKMQMKLNIFANIETQGAKGFFTGFYVPFFKAMKEAGYLEAASNLVLVKGGDEATLNWIKANEEKVRSFMKWLQEYKWVDKSKD